MNELKSNALIAADNAIVTLYAATEELKKVFDKPTQIIDKLIVLGLQANDLRFEIYRELNPVVEQKGKYRYQQELLFQPVSKKELLPRIINGYSLLLDKFGPTVNSVRGVNSWLWKYKGGDYLDKNLVEQGKEPWASEVINKVTGNDSVYTYSLEVTDLVNYVVETNMHLAIKVDCIQRNVAGLFQNNYPKPKIVIQTEDGNTSDLMCTIVAEVNSNSPSTTNAKNKLPCFMEFRKPKTKVIKASLELCVVKHYTNVTNPVMKIFLINPPINNEPVTYGLANKYELDLGLKNEPSVIGVHSYTDDSKWEDFVNTVPPRLPHLNNLGAKASYSPEIWDENAKPDLDLFPHRGYGKILGISEGKTWSLVRSNYDKHGFEPLKKGIGAMELFMPAHKDVADGVNVGYSGTLGTRAEIMLPEPMIGRLDRIFIRYYFRIGTPNGTEYNEPLDRVFNVYQDAQGNKANWTSNGGKFGWVPTHDTVVGGFSGSSGSGYGWQLRNSWTSIPHDENKGPDNDGWLVGWHMFDFQGRNVPGHNYANGKFQESWAQKGGLGGVLYANNWYCIETEVILNSVDKPAVLPDGKPHIINGVQQYWTPNGELRNWIDGRLTYENTGLVFRSLPIYQPAKLTETHLFPIRELGIRSLMFNWFCGGVTVNTNDRVIFVTGLAFGTERIGPMRGL